MWKYAAWSIVLITACDSGPNGSSEEATQSLELTTTDQATIEHGNQSIRVNAGGALSSGRWVPESDPSIVDVFTFAAGDLWIAGTQDGVVRANLTTPLEKNVSFAPKVLPDQDASVYLIRSEDLLETISNWPAELGAPTSTADEPMIFGEVMTWTALESVPESPYSWPQVHGFEGLRVAQSVFGVSDESLDDVLFVRFELENASDTDITNMYVGFKTATVLTVRWSDTACADARTGYDGESAISYTYLVDENAPDFCRGTVAGYAFVGAETDDGAQVEVGSHRLIRKNLGPEPGFGEFGLDGSQEILWALEGLSEEGQPMIDPSTHEPTKWAFSGDPVAGTGWLDSYVGQPRSLVSTTAFNLQAHKSATFTIALMVGSTTSLASGIESLRHLSQEVELASSLWSNPSR
jgi:hypothetical protein